jgi:carbamoyltransferase
MQRIINEKIKFREPFRPFAPAVLAERAPEYFDVPKPRTLTQPENFMLSVCRVRPDMRARIPAVTHVDGTARVQFVWTEHGTMFRRLIEAFDKRAGIPILLNTSFNRRGEPVVASPADAIKTFAWSGLDYLVMNNYVVSKGITI